MVKNCPYKSNTTKLVISFNPFCIFLRFKKSAWDFLGFNFGSGDFIGFCWKPLMIDVCPHSCISVTQNLE